MRERVEGRSRNSPATCCDSEPEILRIRVAGRRIIHPKDASPRDAKQGTEDGNGWGRISCLRPVACPAFGTFAIVKAVEEVERDLVHIGLDFDP